MPRSSGTYSPPAGQPVVSGTVISSTTFNTLVTDIGNELTNSLPRDGSAPPTANIPFGNFKATGLGAATLATDSPQYQQVQSGASTYLTAVAGTNTITASLTTPTLAAYATGNTFRFVAAASNSGAVTININALGAKSITKSGASALSTGDLLIGATYEIIYDGTQFQLVGAGAGASSIQTQAATYFTTGGTSTAYTLTPSPALASLTTGHRFNINFNATAGAAPTLAISGLTAKNIKVVNGAGTKIPATLNHIVSGNIYDVEYDGTDYIVLNPTLGFTTTVALLQASAASLTTNTALLIATITLTPGDWDLSGSVSFSSTSGSFVNLTGWIDTSSTYSNDFEAAARIVYVPSTVLATPTNGIPKLPIPTRRISVSANTNIFLYAQAAFTVAAAVAYGSFTARLIR